MHAGGAPVGHQKGVLARFHVQVPDGPAVLQTQRYLAGEGQRFVAMAGQHAVRRGFKFRHLQPVVEARLEANFQIDVALDAFEAAIDFGRWGPASLHVGHEVPHAHPTLWREEFRHEHVRALLVALPGPKRCPGTDGKPPGLRIEQRGKLSRTVEVGQTGPVDRSVGTHQDGRPAVADDAIGLQRLVVRIPAGLEAERLHARLFAEHRPIEAGLKWQCMETGFRNLLHGAFVFLTRPNRRPVPMRAFERCSGRCCCCRSPRATVGICCTT